MCTSPTPEEEGAYHEAWATAMLDERTAIASSKIEGHTPAPWELRGCEIVGWSTVIATVHWHSGRSAQNDADGALLTAAPVLLKALRDLEAYLRDTPHHNAVEAAAARKAIATAQVSA